MACKTLSFLWNPDLFKFIFLVFVTQRKQWCSGKKEEGIPWTKFCWSSFKYSRTKVLEIWNYSPSSPGPLLYLITFGKPSQLHCSGIIWRVCPAYLVVSKVVILKKIFWEVVILSINAYTTPLNEIIIIIIIMNFYSPVSNTRCHSIGHKMRIARIKIRVDSPGRWERA